jgi:hypothetical protein
VFYYRKSFQNTNVQSFHGVDQLLLKFYLWPLAVKDSVCVFKHDIADQFVSHIIDSVSFDYYSRWYTIVTAVKHSRLLRYYLFRPGDKILPHLSDRFTPTKVFRRPECARKNADPNDTQIGTNVNICLR